MKKLTFNTIAILLTWVLGHILLYIYLNYLIPYVSVNLFTMILWIYFVYFFHYKWAYFMGDNIRRIYVGMDDDKGYS